MRFIVGLLLGILSGGLTYLASDNTDLALIVGAAVAVLYWLGLVIVVVFDLD